MAKRYYDNGSPLVLNFDSSATALMPQKSMSKKIGEPYSSLPQTYGDTMGSMDEAIRKDVAKVHKGFKPGRV